jgi:hypothetical protein
MLQYISEAWLFTTLTLMKEMEDISDTLVFNSTLTWLIAREDFSIIIRPESSESYKQEQISFMISCNGFHPTFWDIS